MFLSHSPFWNCASEESSALPRRLNLVWQCGSFRCRCCQEEVLAPPGFIVPDGGAVEVPGVEEAAASQVYYDNDAWTHVACTHTLQRNQTL